jgi:hypothetical protein
MHLPNGSLDFHLAGYASRICLMHELFERWMHKTAVVYMQHVTSQQWMV